jgi:hypothetical protein
MMPIGVPRVPYKTPNENSWQWVDIWNCLYRERIVWIGQTIDEELGNQLVATMLYLDSVDKSGKGHLPVHQHRGRGYRADDGHPGHHEAHQVRRGVRGVRQRARDGRDAPRVRHKGESARRCRTRA